MWDCRQLCGFRGFRAFQESGPGSVVLGFLGFSIGIRLRV